MPEPLLTLRALNRATLARQMLLERRRLPAARVIEKLVGLQAQAPNPPYVGLWSRIEGFRRDELTALLTKRRVVRTALMRSTLHLVTASDALALRPLLQPVLARAFQASHGRALAGLDAAVVAEAGLRLLAERPRTNAELAAALAARWPEGDAHAMAVAVRCLAPLIHRPPAGTWDSHQSAALVPAAQWLGVPDAPQGVMTQDDLLRRYLAAFGPATLADIGTWSGLANWKPVAERLAPALRSFRDEQGRQLFDLPRAPRPDPDTPAPPRLLAEWDNLLLSHADRARVMAEAHRARVFSVNGIVRGTVLLDGFVAGSWKIERAQGESVLAIERFGRWSGVDRAGVEAEALRLLAFAAEGQRPAVRIF